MESDNVPLVNKFRYSSCCWFGACSLRASALGWGRGGEVRLIFEARDSHAHTDDRHLAAR